MYYYFYGTNILSFCLNENTDNIDWKNLYFASQTKGDLLQEKLNAVQEENFSLSLENYALQTQLEDQKLLRTLESKYVAEVEKENTRLTEQSATEKALLKEALIKLSQTKKALPEPTTFQYKKLAQELLSSLSEAKSEIETLKQKFESIQESQSSENLSKKPRTS
jgi:hypothetical protein